jgi:hypothetical protein
LPYFEPAYDPKAKFDIFSPFDNTKQYLSDQMKVPYSPVTLESFTKNIVFHKMIPGEPVNIGKNQILEKIL